MRKTITLKNTLLEKTKTVSLEITETMQRQDIINRELDALRYEYAKDFVRGNDPVELAEALNEYKDKFIIVDEMKDET